MINQQPSPMTRTIPDDRRYTIRHPMTGQFVKVAFGLSRADLLRLRQLAGDREIIGVLGEYAAVAFFIWAEKYFPEDRIIKG